MYSLAMVFILLPLLYFIYGLLGRKLTINGIDKKAILITGCGSGFGRDLVGRCLQNGFTVFAGCLFETNIKELEERYSSISHGRLYAFQMDVSNDESVQKSRKIVDAFLKEKNLALHALVNNAGVLGTLYYDDFLTLDDYKEVLDVNLYGVIRVTQTFRDLIKKSRGRLVICSSAATLFSAPIHGPYCCSKLAVQAYIIVMRHELLPYGVSVIEIAPGCFKTEIAKLESILERFDRVWYQASQKLHDEYGHDYNEKAKKYVTGVQPKITALDSTWVIDSYYEAIAAKRPKLLYRIGWDALLMHYPYSLLPLRLQLYVMKFIRNLNAAPLPSIVTKYTHSGNMECKAD
ncbi:3beta-hydroxysteroid dehydrogenase [Dirofilaria immitis]